MENLLRVLEGVVVEVPRIVHSAPSDLAPGRYSFIAGVRPGLDCAPMCPHPKLEFSLSVTSGGLVSPAGFSSEIGTLFPIAPCGLTSL